MILGWHHGDDGFTGLELIVILIVLIGVAALLLVQIGGNGKSDGIRTYPGGIVTESMYITGDNLQLTGNVYGFPAVSGTTGNTIVFVPHPDPGRLGVIRTTVSLFMGSTGAIDMDRLMVTWDNGASAERIIQTPVRALTCPNWTISGKYNRLYGLTADSDDLLEPGEQFELTICPSEGIRPYGSMVVTISPHGVAMPLKVSRMAPPRIQPVMDLG
jgi:hypothetical protein